MASGESIQLVPTREVLHDLEKQAQASADRVDTRTALDQIRRSASNHRLRSLGRFCLVAFGSLSVMSLTLVTSAFAVRRYHQPQQRKLAVPAQPKTGKQDLTGNNPLTNEHFVMFSAPEPTLSLLVTATADNWIEVETDGVPSFAKLLRKGQNLTFSASDQIQLLVGNAAGLDARLNGTPIGPFGPSGQKRIVEMTSAGVTVLTRKVSVVEREPSRGVEESRSNI